MLDTQTSPATRYQNAKSMKAIAMDEFPEIGKVVEKLRKIETIVPRPRPDEVAIELKASSMHVDEIYAAQGTSLGRFFGPKIVSKEKPYIMGSSVSGTVVGTGENVTKFAIGDDVIVIPHETGEIGSWATYRSVTEDMVMLKPDVLSHTQAAALTMASCVAWGAIEFGSVRPGDRCLVVGASGAIGILMVQILKSLGAHVTGVCSGKNVGFVRSKGADSVIDYTTQNFGDWPSRSFDRVFDVIGGRRIEQNAFKVLTSTGRFVTVVGPVCHVGERRLSWVEFLRIVGHVVRRYCMTLFGGARYIFSAKLPRTTVHDAMDHIVKHDITMPVEREIGFDLDQIREAVVLLTSHRAKGRIVINFAKGQA